MYFSGETDLTIDDKGRITLPARYRDVLSSGVFVTRGLDGCLFVFPLATWHSMAEKMQSMSLTQASSRLISRMFTSGAELEPDRQGRILLPTYLRDHAGLATDAVMVGSINRLELWSKESWAQETQRMLEEADQNAEQLGVLGIQL
ncbi:MAG: division/cell wall cluster transcriptional repressor MraZ [Chloroflexi bacterium]|nr:division/cell wall cluster transcriptional repressor MraZ [Chloroflexota bacterium]